MAEKVEITKKQERINADTLDIKEKVVSLNRVAKTVKGGRTMRFSALVVVGDENHLLRNSLVATNVNFISIEKLEKPMKIMAKTRYKQKEQPAVISSLGNGDVLVEFETKQRAITPGQSVVFYDGDIVVGGGEIK